MQFAGDPKMRTKTLDLPDPALAIQGLYSFKDSCQSFWTLRAQIELAVFNDYKKEVTEKNE